MLLGLGGMIGGAAFTGIYVVAYLSFGVPSIIAGTFITTPGISITVCGYAALTAMAARPEQIAGKLIAVVLDSLCRTPSSRARRPADGTQ